METRYYRRHAIFPAFKTGLMVKDPKGRVLNNSKGVPRLLASSGQARVVVDFLLSRS